MYLSCLFYYIIRSCDMRQRWDFLKKILPQCAGQDSSLQILLVCRFKGLSFSVRFELRRPALLLLMCSKGLPFSVRFEQYVLEQVEAASSKGLPFSVRFEPIDNQTGIKYICNPSRVSNCAYLFLCTINGATLFLVLLTRRKNHGRTQKYQLICRQ